MSIFHRIVVVFVFGMLVVSCAAPTVPSSPTQPAPETPTPLTFPEVRIVRYPSPADYTWRDTYRELPKYDPDSGDALQVDLRSVDLTHLDLSTAKADLLYADFDNKTAWPAADQMPADFDWQKIMETGKDPGLGLRALHEQGITGKGVNIAIIDQPLLVEHVEYADRIRLYDEIQIRHDTEAQMHGPAVASIAIGKTTGAAPEANLYYVATWNFKPGNPDNLDYSNAARSIRYLLEINKTLPNDQKIRVISISTGLNPAYTGYEDILSAIEEAKAANVFVITVSLAETYGWHIMGLGRDSLSDPNDFQAYEPGLFWRGYFFEQGIRAGTLLIPMDARTAAGPTGKEDYAFYRIGGMSWVVPYLAGTYALAAQVRPEVTPEEFWKTALETGQIIQFQHAGKDYEFGVILDPQALIEALQSK